MCIYKCIYICALLYTYIMHRCLYLILVKPCIAYYMHVFAIHLFRPSRKLHIMVCRLVVYVLPTLLAAGTTKDFE